MFSFATDIKGNAVCKEAMKAFGNKRVSCLNSVCFIEKVTGRLSATVTEARHGFSQSDANAQCPLPMQSQHSNVIIPEAVGIGRHQEVGEGSSVNRPYSEDTTSTPQLHSACSFTPVSGSFLISLRFLRSFPGLVISSQVFPPFRRLSN
jgi:hypothetical protein